MPEGLFSLKVSGDKTKPRASPLGGNPEKVVEKLQSEVPQSNVNWLLIRPWVDKGLWGENPQIVGGRLSAKALKKVHIVQLSYDWYCFLDGVPLKTAYVCRRRI